MDQAELERWHMRRALELAVLGQGHVEPNPMVGCVIVAGAEIIGEGWHRQYGGPHAEIEALRIAGPRARGATLLVTLEPCCHHGKTPPCTEAIIAAGIRRVVAAQHDPFPAVAGAGVAALRAAGIEVEVGLLEEEARALNAPYLKLLATGRPWVSAKWAMTLDGRTATRTGSSRWISSEESRRLVHALRGRVDAIMIGRGTARMDNPLLTARPPGPRTALRIVVDTRASLPSTSQLVRTARDVPLLVAVGPDAPSSERRRLESAGCEVFVCPAETRAGRLDLLLAELGRRRMTNVLVEGGGQLLGTLLDIGQIDEVHVFVAPKIVGGENAPSPIDGEGVGDIASAVELENARWQPIGPDIYLTGRVRQGERFPIESLQGEAAASDPAVSAKQRTDVKRLGR
jgi:diaminohydroxyphosphoribosylaminopyrimidine deaminase/5-amino-6-(5-phosphoribosylamino)uracil reductase